MVLILSMQQNWQAADAEQELQLVSDLQLFYQYGKQYLSQGISEKAAALLGQGLLRVDPDRSTFGIRLKEVVVRLHLLLAEAFLSMSQIENAEQILTKVWNPASPVSIDRHHEDFLWLSRLHAYTRAPATSPSYAVESLKALPLSLYDVSTVSLIVTLYKYFLPLKR